MTTAMLMVACCVICGGEPATTPAERWAVRLTNDLAACDAEEQVTLGRIAAAALVDSGLFDEADAVAAQFVPPEDQPTLTALFAAAAAAHDDMDRAERYLAQLADDASRERAIKIIAARRKADANHLLRSPYADGLVRSLALFVDEAWAQQLFAVVHAANAGELDEMRRLEAAVLKDVPERAPIERTFAHLLLAAVRVDIGETDEALAALQRSHASTGEDIVGIAALFGERLRLYLMARLGHEQTLIDQLAQAEPGEQTAMLAEVLGVIAAEQNRLSDADARHEQLELPEDRVRLAIGVFMGLRR